MIWKKKFKLNNIVLCLKIILPIVLLNLIEKAILRFKKKTYKSVNILVFS